jgi:hypothetical protein
MLGLALYAERAGAPVARKAAVRAAEVFLSRQLFLGRRSGNVMNEHYVRLHYPLYFYYDILGGLKAMADIGLIHDSRCRKALDLLEDKQLPDGGWPAEARHYKVSSRLETRADSVEWGGTGKTRMNEWVSADALYVLRAAGRISI